MPNASSAFDVAVVGGGPAGTSAAITAARMGARVVLFEAREFPRHKVCGEFVSSEALDVLADLLAGRPEAQSLLDTAPRIGRSRLWLGSRRIESAVTPAALSISRYQLDAALWEAAQAVGVDCRANCEISSSEGDGPLRLRAAAETVTARALVIAAGRWSQFTPDRRVPPGPRWIGLKAHFRELCPNPATDLYFFEKGYCGVQPVAKDVVNACAVVRSDRASSLAEVFRLQPRLAERAARWVAVTATASTAPLIYRRPQPVRGHVAFAGDAAGFIDPFVGDGISLALRSGRLAAECLSRCLKAERALSEALEVYRREYARQFAPLFAIASRVRRLTRLPMPAQAAVFELLRLPGLVPLMVRRTRRVA